MFSLYKMGKNERAFNANIMVEFKFNIFDVFKQHFNVHNSVIISFKPNEIVIQTISKANYAEIKGFYTTRIPSESLVEYEFDCNFSEVNVMVTKSFTRNSVNVAGGCKNVSVVSDNEGLAEVSFDLYEKDNRRRRKGLRQKITDYNSEFDVVENLKSDGIFGMIVRSSYLHYLLISRIDCKILSPE